MRGSSEGGRVRSGTRERLLGIVREQPGVCVSDLARLLGVYRAAVRFHLLRLERLGLVRAFPVGRRTLIFMVAAQGGDDLAFRALLAEPACHRVADAIAQNPGLRVVELTRVSGISERALYHHLKQLVSAGLVVRTRSQYFVRFQPSAKLLELLRS